jgi:hypothetical protein
MLWNLNILYDYGLQLYGSVDVQVHAQMEVFH